MLKINFFFNDVFMSKVGGRIQTALSPPGDLPVGGGPEINVDLLNNELT